MTEGLDLYTSKRLARIRRTAWVALVWERLWPLLVPALCVVALFLSVSWLGLWPLLGSPLQRVVLALFGFAFLAGLYPLSRFRIPTREAVDNRIELKTALPHRPVTAQADRQAQMPGSDDPFALALWHESRKRAAKELQNLRAGVPVPKVARCDPFGARAAVVLLLFVAVMAGWDSLGSLTADAFRSHEVVAAADTGRIDAWVKPPAYTNRPPIFLTRDEQGGTDLAPSRSLTVPEGSEVVVRVLALENASVHLVADGLARQIDVQAPANGETVANIGADSAPRDRDSASQTFTVTLNDASSVELRSGEQTIRSWDFAVIPDEAPSIAYVEQPKGSSRGALEFAYEVKDDYGVVRAEADIVSAMDTDSEAQPLIEAPQVVLPLPSRRAKDGVSRTSRDLTAHPWAGAEVTMTLTAHDQADQTGASEAVTFTLPQRVFVRPLALAIVDERRNLALDKRNREEVAQMLDIITSTHPDEFIKNKSVYTGLRVAYRMIERNESDDELRASLDLLWDIALSVEDGDLSAAERRLRDAQERLAEALENGATDEEISKLMDELRQAMNDFMQQLAEQMRKNPEQQAMPLEPNAQVLRQQDLDRMMQRIEDLAKSGSRDAARQLLQDMQRMLNNLQTARPGQQQQQNDQFGEQMNRLGEMMRQQQELMDQTFDMQRRQQQQQNGQRQQGQQQQQGQNGQQQGQNGQQQGQDGQRPMTAEEFAEAMRELQRQQGELQQQMQQMQDAMRGMGMEPSEQLGEAGEAMGNAEGELGQGRTGPATNEQGRALQAMREGAQQMMQQMQNQAQQEGQGQGEGQQRGDPSGQARNDRDPLGRPSRTQQPQLGSETKVPGEIDAQRARRILEAIRERLSDPTRPALELDYLDRLLPTR
ncbi:MAG: TIGR02302 family protein [Ahrensia sp.]|nr:TIGR02302 family protein [Ahrensia sp.]